MVGKSSRAKSYLTSVLFCASAITLSSFPVRAQKGGAAPGSSGGARGGSTTMGGGGNNVYFPPTQPGIGAYPNLQPGVIVPTETIPKPTVVDDEACFPWDIPSAREGSVSAIRLGVPGKARSQYDKACAAFKKQKLAEAEQHARDAIEQYPKYPAAWVMLGQVLESQQKMNEAHDACAQPIKADPTYLPPYLCLAGLLDTEKEWDDLLALSEQFRGLNLVGDMYSDYYRGMSLFHLQKLPEAQKSVSDAIALDTQHHQPGFYFLLAKIYGDQGDVVNAGFQILLFEKYSTRPQDKEEAKEYLAQLQAQQSGGK
jgi:hypothetical protein